jgi:hypothetical protein
VLADPKIKPLLSNGRLAVGGTLIEAWACMKSFRLEDGSGEPPAPGQNVERDFHVQKRSNETHASTNAPDAQLYRKERRRSSQLSSPQWATSTVSARLGLTLKVALGGRAGPSRQRCSAR